MPLMIDAKIKPSGSFPAVDAADVLMPDGKRLTETEFGGSVELDSTLSQSGKAADAQAVGEALAEGMTAIEQISRRVPSVDTTLSQAGQAADAGAVGALMEQAMGVLGSLNTLPDMTEADNGKIPQVVDGQIVYTDPASMTVGEVTLETYIGNAVNSYIEEALGGEY